MIDDRIAARRRAMLAAAFGPEIEAALADPAVTDILLNPDGMLRVERAGEPLRETGRCIDVVQAERIIRLVAAHLGVEASPRHPILSADLPVHADGRAGERFEAALPPVAAAPCFAIRVPAVRDLKLTDYAEAGIMTPDAARLLSLAVVERRNILIAGGTGSGKTTLANALLAEMTASHERVILIEDTRELQSPVRDTVALRTRTGAVSMADLVRSALRLRPDRIIVGEVRGGEALDLLKAWNTGHPGGLATVHANGSRAALYRLELLVQECIAAVPRRLIADAVDIVAFVSGRGPARRLTSLTRVQGLTANGDYALEELLSPPCNGDLK